MLYDLTHPLNPELPVYPGDPHVKVEQVGVLDKDGFADRLVTMGTHNGTHVDAPAHMIDGGKQLKDYPIGRFVTNAVCIDARNGFDQQAITALVTVPNMAVIFLTGASAYFTEERYWHDYTIMDGQTIKTLMDLQVKMIGVDTGNFDSADDFPIHKELLGADILLIENLTNLEPLAGKTFELYALPLKLEADGAPARVIARTD